jgi:F-type H+-transporting ATPase subunit b
VIGIAYAAEAGGSHEEAFYLNPEFWVAVAFVIFVVLLFRKGMRTVGGALDARSARIAQSITQAQHLREEAEAALALHQQKQQEALKEAQAIVAQARVEAERLKTKAAADLERQLAQQEKHALERIAQAEQTALAEVRNVAVDVAIAAARAVLKEQIGQGMAQELVDQAIAQMPERMH